MKEVGLKILSSYERGVLEGLKKSRGDRIVEKMMTSTVVNQMLGTRIEVEKLSDGTTITATAEELVVMAAIADAIERGSMEKLKTLMTIKGELKETSEVTLSLVDKDLLTRAVE